jgi:hypothetical protein
VRNRERDVCLFGEKFNATFYHFHVFQLTFSSLNCLHPDFSFHVAALASPSHDMMPAFIINYKLSSRVFKLVFKIITFCFISSSRFFFLFFFLFLSLSTGLGENFSVVTFRFVISESHSFVDSNHVYNDNGS